MASIMRLANDAAALPSEYNGMLLTAVCALGLRRRSAKTPFVLTSKSKVVGSRCVRDRAGHD